MQVRISWKFAVEVIGDGMLGRGVWGESRITKGSGVSGIRSRE